MTRTSTLRLAQAALFVAIGWVLPFLTGQVPRVGNLLLPMHLPVMLCGLICGWQYGLCVGCVLPLTRSLLFGRPLFYPSAVAMAAELATYGFVIGFTYARVRRQNVCAVYGCLAAAMIAGRIVWGIVETLLLGGGAEGFTAAAFVTGAFVTAVPGIVLQLAVIPAIMLVLDRTRLVPFRRS